MVFMGDRRAEESEDSVAHRLGHVPFVTMHCLHHQLEGWIDDKTGVFRIEVLDERGRAFDVGKEDSDSLAFAIRAPACLHRRSLGQNALSEILRCVARRGLGARRARRPKSRVRSLKGRRTQRERGTTLTTEFEAGQIFKPTLGAAVLEWRAALATELHTLGIVLPAARTLHVSPFLYSSTTREKWRKRRIHSKSCRFLVYTVAPIARALMAIRQSATMSGS